MTMATLWLLLFIVFVIAEVATSVALVSVWFCIGAVVAMILAKSGVAFVWQLTAFVIVSVVSLVLTKPLVKKFKPVREATNLDAIIGGTAIVTETIDNIAVKGEAKIDGKYWRARSIDNSIIEVGAKVKIVKIQGVRIFVDKI